jgi:hypothetical protein
MRRLLLWLTLLSVTGCIYDHRVTQAILERRRRAKEAEGAKIGQPRSRSGESDIAGVSVSMSRTTIAASMRSGVPRSRSSSTRVPPCSDRPFAVELDSELREWTPKCDRDPG